jgi:DNA-directed RNA polymerase sigma subunit (sigma70/sigma32)
VRAQLSARLGRSPSFEELSGATSIPVRHLEDLAGHTRAMLSLDAPIGDEDGARIGDQIPSCATNGAMKSAACVRRWPEFRRLDERETPGYWALAGHG